MVEAASMALADSLNEEERALDMVYPRIERIREISTLIATRVIRGAQKDVSIYFTFKNERPFLWANFFSQGTDQTASLRALNDDELMCYVKSKMWQPAV